MPTLHSIRIRRVCAVRNEGRKTIIAIIWKKRQTKTPFQIIFDQLRHLWGEMWPSYRFLSRNWYPCYDFLHFNPYSDFGRLKKTPLAATHAIGKMCWVPPPHSAISITQKHGYRKTIILIIDPNGSPEAGSRWWRGLIFGPATSKENVLERPNCIVFDLGAD